MVLASPLRILGPYERYSLARSNIGFPPVPVFVAVLDTPIAADALNAAVSALLKRYPLLSCCIPEPSKPFPRFAANPGLRAVDVVSIVNTSPPELPILLSSPATIELRTGPLWRVVLYSSESPVLVLHAHHVISDGVSSRNLLIELLQLIGNPVDKDAIVPTAFPPTLEATVNVRPPLTQLLHTIFSSLILPRLPAFLRVWLTPRGVWPGLPRVAPQGCPPRIALIRLPAPVVPALKTAARQHGVRTLHPLLMAVGLHAIWTMAGRGDVLSAYTSPASERAEERGHPACTGNYVSAFQDRVALTPRRAFWPLARQLAASLASPAQRARARGTTGLLSYVPRPNEVNARGQTGWEQFFEHSVGSVVPFDHTFGISNIGLIPRCPGLKEVAWTQDIFPGGGHQPFGLNVVTTADGPMYVAINWRDGLLDDAEMDVFKSTYEKTIDRLVRGDVTDDTAFDELLP